MKVSVYDTYYVSDKRGLMHFDVLVEHGTDKQAAYTYAQEWLVSIGENGATLRQDMCNYCHFEQAPDALAQHITDNRYFILQMEGCPNPRG